MNEKKATTNAPSANSTWVWFVEGATLTQIISTHKQATQCFLVFAEQQARQSTVSNLSHFVANHEQFVLATQQFYSLSIPFFRPLRSMSQLNCVRTLQQRTSRKARYGIIISKRNEMILLLEICESVLSEKCSAPQMVTLSMKND